LLCIFAAKTPGFTQDEALLGGVIFEGDDLSSIPDPIKSQAVTAVLHASFDIVGLKIANRRDRTQNTKTQVNTKDAEVKVNSTDEAYALMQDQVRIFHASEIQQLMVKNGMSDSIVYHLKAGVKLRWAEALHVIHLSNILRKCNVLQ
jgi:hypothetical protein